MFRLVLGVVLISISWVQLSAQNDILVGFGGDKDLLSATIGIEIINLSKGHSLVSKNVDLAIAPASTMKVATTAAALQVLGSDFRYRSQLAHGGGVINGHLDSDLILSSDGDPTLGSKHLSTPSFDSLLQVWSSAVTAAGIKSIEGDIVVDASYYGRVAPPGSWQYQDLGNYYGSGNYSFNLNDNLFVVDFLQAPVPGQSTTVRSVVPEVPDLVVHNEVLSGAKGSGDQAYIYGSPYQSAITIRGTIPPGAGSFEIKGSVPNPPYFAAYHLQQALKEAGVLIKGEIKVVYEPMPVQSILWQQESVALLDILDATNRSSVNLFAESLGMRMEKEAADFGLKEFWSDSGVDIQGVDFHDYSGLSKNNVVTASFMSDMLGYIFHSDQLFEPIKNGLSVAGESGTMRSMLRRSPARGKVWGKSGSIAGVRCYIGYMEAKSGDWLSFALLAQNYSCSSGAMRRKFEDLLDAVYQAN